MTSIFDMALRIYGGEINGSLQIQPFIAVGNVPDEFRPMLPTIVDEQQVWMITHAQNYTLYTTLSKRCYTSDGQPGQTLICLFLPPQKRLADGNSPLGLLDAIMDCWVVQALRDGRLPKAPAENIPFVELLKKYRLEDRPKALLLPVMQGMLPAAFCVQSRTQLDALMRHSRYPELSAVGCLELGFSCNSTIVLNMNGGASQTRKKIEENRKMKPKPPIQNFSEKEDDIGGMPLNHEIINVNRPNIAKKIMIIVAIVLGVAFGMVALFIFDRQEKDDMKEVVEAVEDSVFPVQKRQSFADLDNEQMEVEEAELSKLKQDEGNDEEKVSNSEVVKIRERETKKMKEEEDRKKLEEKKRREEEEARKKKEQIDQLWQSKVQEESRKCPTQLRAGVRISSLAYTAKTVTCTIVYEELSIYNLDSDDREVLSSDKNSVATKYKAMIDIPPHVQMIVVQKDRVGRVIN